MYTQSQHHHRWTIWAHLEVGVVWFRCWRCDYYNMHSRNCVIKSRRLHLSGVNSISNELQITSSNRFAKCTIIIIVVIIDLWLIACGGRILAIHSQHDKGTHRLMKLSMLLKSINCQKIQKDRSINKRSKFPYDMWVEWNGPFMDAQIVPKMGGFFCYCYY